MPTYVDLKQLKKAFLISVSLGSVSQEERKEHIDELERLCETFGLTVIEKNSCTVRQFESKTYLGSGKLEELKQLAKELGAEVVIFDEEISPHQQRNLEKVFGCSVIDRTELILEVFAQRAQTREAQLQIELARVKYQLPRLKRLWTHLSRQSGSSSSGGGAYLKGDGEKQIEIDRRLIKTRIDRLKEELKQVVAHRQTQRSLRSRTQIPTFAIVGYTNAGKSTLLKALTQADVLIEDKLFATLDTTTRKFLLPNKQEVLLVDTVGFIRKIPHDLVAAFKSTLEEAVHTDILLHIIDVSHPFAESQAEETMKVLKELGVHDQPIITVLNKIDQVTNPFLITKFRVKYPKIVPISALNKEGFELLLQTMIAEISALRKEIHCRIPQSHYGLVAELMKEGKILDSSYEENDILLHIEIPGRLEHKVRPFLVLS